MTKKNGGTIKNWQLHTLSVSVEQANNQFGFDIKTDKVYILSGTVASDPTGRWREGDHMRSSVVISIQGNIIETENTMYEVLGEMGGDVFGDLGDNISNIFY